MTQLKIRISRTGQVTIDVLNAQGAQCSTLTKVLEQALGDIRFTFLFFCEVRTGPPTPLP